MKKAFILCLSVLLISFAAGNAFALDGKRNGFHLGFGLGLQKAYARDGNWLWPLTIKSEPNIAGSLQLGYGISNKFVALLGVKAGYVSFDDLPGSLSVGGIGAAYYFSRKSPSVYLSALVGRGHLSVRDAGNQVSDSGSGVVLSMGYELDDRIQLELSAVFVDVLNSNIDSDITIVDGTFATVQYLFY